MSATAAFPGFRLRLTRWGGAYLLLTTVLGFAAVNTGNNALMATLGLALGAFAVSGTWSRQVLASISASVRLPSEIYAGRPTVLEVELGNGSRWFPAYGVVLRDGAGRSLLVEPLLTAGARRRHAVEVVFPARGWVALDDWRVEVLLPLGFFLKSKQAAGLERVLVYPKLLPSSPALPRSGRGAGRHELWRPSGREGDVTQLREYREGDELRQLHWKQTARQGRLIAIDRERPAERPVVFVLDPRLPGHDQEPVRERFERLVSEIATAVVERLRQGAAVGVVVGPTAVGPVRHLRALRALLEPLSVVRPQAPEAPIELPRPPAGVAVVQLRLAP